MIIQPERFFIEPPLRDVSASVYASYDDLLEQSKQQDGSLQFDGVILNTDWQTSITYKIVAWDTLSTIAQDFGTTVQALAEKNWLDPNSVLRKWQELIITFTENFVYQVEKESTLEEFANAYGLNINDLMSLNYLTPPSVKIVPGQELILPLTRNEAKLKWLIGVEEFIPLEIIEEQPEEEIIDEETEVVETPKERSKWIDDSEQEIITAEETENHLKSIEEQKEKQRNDRLAAEKRAEEEKKAKAEKAAQIAQIKQQAPASKPKANNTCSTDKCMFNGKCYNKPVNAVCAPQDKQNAWVCKEWYTDTGKSCVKAGAKTTKKTTATAQKKLKQWVISQRYFNAKKTWYPYNGRARGHCTEYVDYRWWKNLWKQSFWRGNANRWYANASAAWAKVWKTPQYGAAAVFSAGTNSYRWYGHVAVVIDIDRDNNLILVEEQNYVGTYVVNQRRVSMNQPIWYVYP
jgi:surface antigen/LysM repeat protein